MTMRLIESKTLATAAASIEFTSIPQDGTDLVVLNALRNDTTQTQYSLRFNGVTTGYSRRVLLGFGTGVGSYAGNDGFAGHTGASSYTANTFSNNLIYIPNYAGSTNKSWSADSVSENNATAADQDIVAGLWSNTAAITSLALIPDSGSFVAGSTVSLYKITKGSDGIVTTSP